jgi:prevent-host-death family protein
MPIVNLFEAKNRFSALIDQVEEGEEVTITRRGRAVARIVPVATDGAKAKQAVAELDALRQNIASRGHSFPWTELKAYRDEGRR